LSYKIRPCRNLNELGACVDLQKAIWGYTDRELYPLRLFRNLTQIGGHVLGAFSSAGQLVGFVASMSAWRGKRRYYHSLSLGVLPEHANRGLGRSLKMAQRRAALRVGIRLIEWTFDPLRAKNAFLNIVRLGVIVRRYLPDYYGCVESRLQQGLPSDRLIAEWWLNSARVKRALRGGPPWGQKKNPAAEVLIPNDIESLAEAQPTLAREQQAAVREQLQRLFARKLAITGLVRDEAGSHYLLENLVAAGLPRRVSNGHLGPPRRQ
jgi:predicted GNAT superfamily acetyltransferase